MANGISRYVLMNRDTPVLDFECRRTEFGEPRFFEGRWHTDRRPIGYRSLASFLVRRKAPKHRKHIQQLLEQYGCDDLEGFLQVIHALSLNDTFWVRRADSGLTWRKVSLYTNPFNEIISQAAFDGTISETDLSSTSPEFGTDGYYAKCWVREKGGIQLYKSGSDHYEIEPLSEYLAAQLAAELCPGAVAYDMAYYHGKLISKCPLFTSEAVGLAKAGVLFDTATMKMLGMAPVFDHNRSLFPALDNDQLASPEWHLRKCRPRLGTDFLLTARGLLTDGIRRDLKRLEDFSFRQHPRIRAEQERLDSLSKIVQNQIHQILSA